MSQRLKVILGNELHIRRGGIGNAPVDAPLDAVGQHADGIGAAGNVLFEVTLYLPVGRAVASLAGGSAVKIDARLFRFYDDGGVAGRGGNGMQKAGFVQTVALLAVLRYPMRGRVAQSIEGRPYQQRQRTRLVEQWPPVGNMPQPLA